MVIIAKRIHLFSYRTQKLSFSAPKVVALTGRKDRSLPHSISPLSNQRSYFLFLKVFFKVFLSISFLGMSFLSRRSFAMHFSFDILFSCLIFLRIVFSLDVFLKIFFSEFALCGGEIKNVFKENAHERTYDAKDSLMAKDISSKVK